ncbi:MAG: heavy metal-associated domain-containing protein [Candidatus Pacearchaeota archaeon]|nr:heavy metal-associated domain-containing protein [Candidatus Pacearchaeota archaeon]
MKKIKLTIQGMHCGSCAGNIERSLKKVSGVKTASVSMMTNKGIVEIEDDVLEEDLKKAVSRAGYKVLKAEEE